MAGLRNALGIAVLVCAALPAATEIATELLPVVLTLFVCAAIFTAATSHHRPRGRRRGQR